MFKYTDVNGNIRSWKLGVHMAIALVILIVVLSSLPFTTVGAGQKGVVLKFGQIQPSALDEGLHIISPIGTDVVKINTQVQKDQVKASAASKDLQTVSTEIAVNYHINPDKVVDVYRAYKTEVTNILISPALQESVKAASAKYTAEELVTKREVVRDEMEQNVKEKVANTGVHIDGFNIIDFDFSPQFNAAIEAKVTAEQNAKAALNKVAQIEAEAKQQIAKAQADAESTRLNIQAASQAAASGNYIQLKQLEVQLEQARRWNGVLPQNIYGSAPIPFLQVGK